MKFERSRELQRRSHALIPGGAHTYAKGDDQYPIEAPGFLVRGEGCRVWDADGNEFIEYGMGLRAVTLGHGYAPVVEAATRALASGTNFTRPAAIEVALAERMTGLIEAAEMAKFTKNGSDATTAAIKLARAATGRDKLLYCRSHPFFSTDDWFIGTTPMRAGVPPSAAALSIGFDYNDASGLEAQLEANPGQIACVILEPAAVEEPKAGFLEAVRELCDQHGSLLILDETITGFRWHLRGAQTLYHVAPDLSIFGKALGNGIASADARSCGSAGSTTIANGSSCSRRRMARRPTRSQRRSPSSTPTKRETWSRFSNDRASDCASVWRPRRATPESPRTSRRADARRISSTQRRTPPASRHRPSAPCSCKS
jgi:glutamate-1-semialdehyde 2,1-aminomutase